MTDPGLADRTYIEPLTWEIIEKIIEKERPDALLPTLSGQTGLNVSMDLFHNGVLEKYGVEMIGAKPEVINKAEDRDPNQGDLQSTESASPVQSCSATNRKPPDTSSYPLTDDPS